MKINSTQTYNRNTSFGIKISDGKTKSMLDRAIESLKTKDILSGRIEAWDVQFRKYPTPSYDYVITATQKAGPSIHRKEYFYNTMGYMLFKDSNNSGYRLVIGANSAPIQDKVLQIEARNFLSALFQQKNGKITEETAKVSYK